jgi:predicted nucleic acid-binding Zn ribbon protein
MLWELGGAALLGTIILWLVLQPLVRRSTPRAPIYVPPDPEETRRGVALAALREIEFDRETGKLSDADYAYLKARYTAEALAALRADEADGGDESDVEALIAVHARALATATASCVVCGPRPEHDAAFCSSCGRRVDTGHHCAQCGAVIPPDAVFCERCGTAVAA